MNRLQRRGAGPVLAAAAVVCMALTSVGLSSSAVATTTEDPVPWPAPYVPPAQVGPGVVDLFWSLNDPVPGTQESATVRSRITVSPGGKVLEVPLNMGTGIPQYARVTGLTNGVEYTFSIAAVTAAGPGQPATTVATPRPTTRIFGVGDFDGDKRPDLVGYVPRSTYGVLSFYRGTGTGSIAGRINWGSYRERPVPGGDLNADGKADLLGVFGSELLVYFGNGRGGFTGWDGLSRVWSALFTDGGVDFSGDRRTDVLAVTASGRLLLCRGDGKGHIAEPQVIGTGWAKMLAVFSPGDFSGDGRPDLIAVDRAGAMWLYRGNGSGGFLGSRTLVGTGWSPMAAIFPARDFNGDGRSDLGALTADGALYLFPGSGTGQLRKAKLMATGWQAYIAADR